MASYSLSVSSGENLINGVTYSASGATIGAGNKDVTVSLSCSGGAWSSNVQYTYDITVNTTGGSLSGSGSIFITDSSGGTVSVVLESNFGSTVTITSIYAKCIRYPTNSSYPNGYSRAWGGTVYIDPHTSSGGGGGSGYVTQLNTPTNLRLSCNGITGTSISVQPGAKVTLAWAGVNGTWEGSTYIKVDEYLVFDDTDAVSPKDYVYGRSYTTVTAPSNVGAVRKYRIKARSDPSGHDSEFTSYVTLTVISNALAAPTNVRLDSTLVSPSGTTTLRWNAVNSVANNQVTGYTIYKNGTAIGTENNTTAYVVTANSSGGKSDTFTVVANGSVSNSAASSGVALRTYTNPGAPTARLSASAAPPNSNVTLSWSGASNGSYNNITGYEVYRKTGANGSFSKQGNTLAANASSLTVKSSSTQGEVYYYKIRVLGTVSGTYADSSTVSLTSYTYEKVGAPSTITMTPSIVPAGGSATLVWGSGTERTYVSIVGYEVYRCTSINGTYTKLGNTIVGNSLVVYAPNSGSYYYKVKAIASVSGYNSDLSTPSASLMADLSPTVPTGLTVTPAEYNSGSLTFTWNASTDPESDTIYYKIEMSYNNRVTTVATGISTTSYSVDLSNTIARGTSATFYVYAYDAYSSSNPSQSVIVTRVALPSSSDIELVNYVGNVCYSQYPKLIYKTKKRLRISNVAGWTVSNQSFMDTNEYFMLICNTKQEPSSSNSSDNISMSFTMTLTDEYGNVGTVTQTLTVALPDYINDMAVVNTHVRASHMNNLRLIVSTHYKFMTGANYPSWASGSIVAGNTQLALWLTHLTELRTCIEATVNAINNKLGSVVIPAPTWQSVTQNIPKASAMNQIWTYIRDNL